MHKRIAPMPDAPFASVITSASENARSIEKCLRRGSRSSGSSTSASILRVSSAEQACSPLRTYEKWRGFADGHETGITSPAMARPIAAITLTDPTFSPKDERNVFERAALSLINDERDLPFVWLSLQMTVVLIPTTVALFWPGVFQWWMAPIYWAVLFLVFFDRFILMLHNTSHRRLYKRKYSALGYYIPWVLGPFCGETPETYS